MLQDTSNKSPALLSGQPINHYGQTEYFQNKGAEVVANLGSSHKLQLKLASEKGASSWLTALGPTEKKQFKDASISSLPLSLLLVAGLCTAQKGGPFAGSPETDSC